MGGTRLARLGATFVDFGPALAPLFPFAGCLLAGEGRGIGGMGLVLVFGIWSGVAAAVVSSVNAWLVLRRKQTVGLAYFELVYTCETPFRLVSAKALLLALPCLLWFGAGAANEGDFTDALTFGPPLAAIAVNWLFWLGPSERTLGDRLGGARVVRQPATGRGFSPRSPWPDVLLLGPPLVMLPLAAQFHGGAAGDFVALVVLGLPVLLTRFRH